MRIHGTCRYDWRTRPISRFYSFARNTLSRPPYVPGNEQNWDQRETLTTDGSGAYGTGTAVSVQGTSIHLSWNQYVSPPLVGCTIMVLQGPGSGQHRTVVAVGSVNGSMVMDAPLDDWVALEGGPTAPSVFVVVSSFGSKLIVGNHFNWTEVVQWYGNTVRGVIADNTITNANVHGGTRQRGTISVVGECYHGSDPVFYTETLRNHMVNSDGIGIRDSAAPNGPGPCAGYRGPWVRWSVVRANAIRGISVVSWNESNMTGMPPACGSVYLYSTNVVNMSTDIVGEHDQFECPPQGNTSTSGYHIGDDGGCSHCVQRL
eukprot:m.219062 g.219062  ORF g.219062 m.219062 type:complete len:317 (-) comp30322_c0_seq1:122-1072(-)